MADSKPIQSIQRAMQIINQFDETHLEFSLAELSAALRLNKSTVYGIVRTLEQEGYLVQNSSTKYYHLGTKFISRSLCAVSSLQIISLAAPFLQELNRKYQFATNLFLHENGSLLCVYALGSNSLLSLKTEVGSTVPLFASASGKALTAALPLEELETCMRCTSITPFTPKTVTDPNKLRAQLADVARLGYAFEDQEFKIGISSIAALLRDSAGIAGTISMTGSVQRMKPILEEMAVDLMVAAGKISDQLT